jgi:hypothetical protein
MVRTIREGGKYKKVKKKGRDLMFKSKKNQENRVLTRPESTRPYVPNGKYDGEIESTEVAERDSKYHAKGKRDVLSFRVGVFTEDGDVVPLNLEPNLSWHPKSKLVQLLQDLDALPEPREDLDLDALVGMRVTVTVENVEKNGENYSNIIEMKKKTIKKYQKPATTETETFAEDEDIDLGDLDDFDFEDDVEVDFED